MTTSQSAKRSAEASDLPYDGQPSSHPHPAESASALNPYERFTLLDSVSAFVESYMSRPPFDTSHDFSHIRRVLALSEHLATCHERDHPDLNLDMTAIRLVAMLHDVADHKYVVNDTAAATATATAATARPANGEARTAEASGATRSGTSETKASKARTSGADGADGARTSADTDSTTANPSPIPPPPSAPVSPRSILLSFSCPPGLAALVQTLSAAVSVSRELAEPAAMDALVARYPELAVVQDADRLDAMGATGVGRAFTYGGAWGRTLQETMDHWERLLLREGLMRTREGRRMGRVRAERLRAFKAEWEAEMGMKGRWEGWS